LEVLGEINYRIRGLLQYVFNALLFHYAWVPI
jgi:hypothetical protein